MCAVRRADKASRAACTCARVRVISDVKGVKAERGARHVVWVGAEGRPRPARRPRACSFVVALDTCVLVNRTIARQRLRRNVIDGPPR